MFLPLQPKRTVTTQVEALAQLVMKGRHCVVEIVEMEPAFVVIPLVSEYLQWALRHLMPLQVALLEYPGQLKMHYPPHKYFSVLQTG